MWRKLLISLVILHVKLFTMKHLTTLAQNMQPVSPSNTTEAIKDELQPVTNENSTNTQGSTPAQEIQSPTNTQGSTPAQEIQSSKHPSDEASQNVSSYQHQQPNIQDSDQTNKASVFLKELQTGLPASKDDYVPIKAKSEYLKKNSLVEDGAENETYSERSVYIPRGGSAIIPCVEKINMKSTVKSITHVWTDHLGKDIKKRRQPRLKVDEKYQLSVSDAQPEDAGIYHCLLTLVYTDNGEEITTDNLINLNVYVNPDLALEFPFIFESMTCNKARDKMKLRAIQNIICTTSPCVYEFEMTCSVEPWLHTNMPYIPRSKLLILATKFPDPDYKPPECNRDCIMGNKFDHLLGNLAVVQKAIDTTANDSDLTYFSGLTMLNRKVVYSCDAGFSLFRESCVPCFPGTYNPKRRVNLCVSCPVNTYTQQPGARDCLQCSTGKRTEAAGADSIHKCIDKEIKIIRFRMAFYILCGIVCGLLGIILAVFIVRIRDKIKKFFIPAEKPKEIPSESSKLLKNVQRKPPLETIPENDLPLEKKPSSKKLSATTFKPETLQPVIQEARERLKKRQEETYEGSHHSASDTKSLKAATSNQMVHRPPPDSTIRSKETLELEEKLKKKTSESSLRIRGSVHDAANITTDHLSHTAAEGALSQPEEKAVAPEKSFTNMLKRSHSQLSGIIHRSVHDAASLAASFTVPVSSRKMSKATILSKQTKQLTPSPSTLVATQPPNQAHTPQPLPQQHNLPLKVIPQPPKTPSNIITTSNQPSNLPTNTSNVVLRNHLSANMPLYQAQPTAAASDQPQAQPVQVPPGASAAQPTAVPVGQIQPPDQPGLPSHNNYNPQITSPSNALQTQTNPPQVGMSSTQQATNDQTQAFQTGALTRSATNVPSAAGQVPQKATSYNLNQNAVFPTDYSRSRLLKREGLEQPDYAKRSYPTQDHAPGGQRFIPQPQPYYLYDQVLWMPNATASPSPSRTNIVSTEHARPSLPPQQGPSKTDFTQKSVIGYGHDTGVQWNQREGPHASQNTYSIHQPNYYPNSRRGYHNIGPQGYHGSGRGHER